MRTDELIAYLTTPGAATLPACERAAGADEPAVAGKTAAAEAAMAEGPARPAGADGTTVGAGTIADGKACAADAPGEMQPGDGSAAATGLAAELDALTARYPWFVPARILREIVTGTTDPRLALTAPWRVESSLRRAAVDASSLAKRSPEEIIDRFLQEKNLRIVAGEGPADEEVLTQPELEDEDEVVTEELAEIYLAQGLRDKAAAIYRKLSLRNPEKSVYFAELIARTENNN